MSRHKKMYINKDSLVNIEAVGPAQEKAFKAYEEGKNLFLSGSAGTGKTFILLHLAFKEVLDRGSQYDKVVVVRSLLPSRDIGERAAEQPMQKIWLFACDGFVRGLGPSTRGGSSKIISFGAILRVATNPRPDVSLYDSFIGTSLP